MSPAAPLLGVKMATATRWIAAPDLHGDMQDQASVEALLDVTKTFRPTVRIQTGDLFDVRCLRRGAGSEETLEDLKEDIEAGLEFLHKFRPTHWLRGNHDERIVDAINSHNPVLRRYASQEWENISEHLQKVGCKVVLPYNKRMGVLKIGKLRFCHGYGSGMYTAKKHAEVYGNVVFAHSHAVDNFAIPGIEEVTGWNIGCLCRLELDYNRAQINTLRQRHGFAYGLIYPNGKYALSQAVGIDGAWLYPSDFRERRD